MRSYQEFIFKESRHYRFKFQYELIRHIYLLYDNVQKTFVCTEKIEAEFRQMCQKLKAFYAGLGLSLKSSDRKDVKYLVESIEDLKELQERIQEENDIMSSLFAVYAEIEKRFGDKKHSFQEEI